MGLYNVNDKAKHTFQLCNETKPKMNAKSEFNETSDIIVYILLASLFLEMNAGFYFVQISNSSTVPKC